MTKKHLRWILMGLGIAVLAAWLVLRFALGRTGLMLDAAALSLIGLSLSMECTGEKYRVLLWVFRALSILVIAGNVVTWFVSVPAAGLTAIRLVAIGANLPLAVLGLQKDK